MEELEQDSTNKENAPGNSEKESTDKVKVDNSKENLESTDKVKVDTSKESLEKSEKIVLPTREELVCVAVKFLQNNKVQSSSYQLKRNFLLKKGLSEPEIQTAFARVGVSPESTPPPPSLTPPSHHAPFGQTPPNHHQGPPMGHQMVPYQIQTYQNSFSSKIRDFANFLIFIGGASYAINFLWKKYVRPWLYGPTTASPKAALVTTVQSLLQAVDTLKAGVTQLHHTVDKYNHKVDKLLEKVDQVAVAGGNDGWRQTLLEVKSVKGLMLSSQQFPSHPPTPAIPAWQRLEPSQINKIGPDIVATSGKENIVVTSGKENNVESSGKETGEDKSSNDSEVAVEGGKRGSSSSEIELIGEDSLNRSSSDSDEGGAFKQIETCREDIESVGGNSI